MEQHLVGELIYEGSQTRVHRGIHGPTGEKLVVKLPTSATSRPQTVGRLLHEHQLLNKLAGVSGVVRTRGIQQKDGQTALWLEDPELRSLDRVLAERKRLSVVEVLRQGMSLAHTLDGIHGAGIIHKDIKPQNILVDEACTKSIVIDFGIASELLQETAEAALPEAMEGTLRYLSPEQTGRTARGLDSRTDLYSLGVTLFEMLAGEPPFLEQDPLALVYAHLAKLPPALETLVPLIPRTLVRIVERCLEKAPEKRYQTARGLAADLERCLKMLVETDDVVPFALGQRDFSSRLQISQTLVGRDKESLALTQSFERAAAGGVEVLLLSGHSGVGKTALVRSVYGEIAKAGRGLLLSGKHDQLGRDISYAALAQAFSGLLRGIAASPKPVFDAWREQLHDKVGPLCRVIADFVPELEWVTGPLAAVPEVPTEMMHNRIRLSWINFVRAVTDMSPPLVLFLDDLQWVDPATLELLKTLLLDVGRKHLLVIASYRGNEMDASHPLWPSIAVVEKSGVAVVRLELGPLSVMAVAQWLAGMFGQTPNQVRPLSEKLHGKTQGNPFFLTQLLLELQRQRRVFRNLESGVWEWDADGVEQAGVTDNVVDLMTRKLALLPSGTQELLGKAACTGYSFGLHEVSVLTGWDRKEVVAGLRPALQEGLVLPIDGQYREIHALAEEEMAAGLDAGYRFLHDRVQQACYEWIAPAERARMHLLIGQRLEKAFDQNGGTTQQLLEFVQQLNLGASALERADERKELARRNLRAAQNARAIAAYDTALSCLSIALSLLSESDFDEHYELCRDVHAAHAEALALLGQAQPAQLAFIRFIDRLKTSTDRALCYLRQSEALQSAGKPAEAYAYARAGIALFGIPMPDTPEQANAMIGARLPKLLDPEILTALQMKQAARPSEDLPSRLYERLIISSYFAAPFNLGCAICLGVEHILHAGIAAESSTIIAWFATLAGIVEQFNLCVNLAEFSIALSAGKENNYARGKTETVSYAQCLSWKYPYEHSIKLMTETFERAHLVGDFQYASYMLLTLYLVRHTKGNDCRDALLRCRAWHDYCRKYVPLELGQAKIRIYCLHRLMGIAADHFDAIDVEGILDTYEADRNATDLCESLVEIATTHALFGELDAAWAASTKAEPLLAAGAAGNLLMHLSFHETRVYVAAALLSSSNDPERQQGFRQAAQASLQKINVWAKLFAENVTAYHELALAAFARAEGRQEQAWLHNLRALEHAREQGQTFLAARACEALGNLARSNSQNIARGYFLEAQVLYETCGALGKAQPKWPLPSRPDHGQPHSDTNAATSYATSTTSGIVVDVNTTIRAAQTLARELEPQRVVGELMRLVRDNAGAQRAALIFCQNDDLTVAALLSDSQVRTGLSERLSSAHPVASSVVQYVQRSREAVVIGDTLEDSRFAQDLRLQGGIARSVLAAPLLHQGRLGGILYLEHAAPSAFPQARVELLGVLAAQSAIALENARLYADLQAANAGLETKVTERTAELDSALKELWTEMDLARKIQTVLLPQNPQLPGYELAAVMRPADQVGGDYYDVFPQGDKHWVLIGDVSGHGVPAGLCQMMIQTAIRTAALVLEQTHSPQSPARLLGLVNEAVENNLRQIGRSQYMTLTALTVQGGCVRYAGLHQELLVYRAVTKTVERIETQGIWIGASSGDITEYLQNEELHLNTGDMLLLYTDGYTEAKISEQIIETKFLAESYLALAQKDLSCQELLDGLLKALDGARVVDDVTLVALRRLRDPQEAI